MILVIGNRRHAAARPERNYLPGLLRSISAIDSILSHRNIGLERNSGSRHSEINLGHWITSSQPRQFAVGSAPRFGS
jgi:hypothetical protein